ELTREVGLAHSQRGTTAAGTVAIVDVARSLGVPSEGVALHDGSGLAPDNHVTCDALLEVVELSARPKFAAIDDGLPVAGTSGTPALRFGGAPLRGILRGK